MDYPLMKREIKEIKEYIDSFPISISESDMPYGNKIVFDFLHKNGFFTPGPNLSSWPSFSSKSEKWYCLENKAVILKEIQRCTKKAKSSSKREWKIGISSAVIGGIFGIISSLISVNLIG